MIDPVFYAIALCMTLGALGFVVTPLAVSYRRNGRGFAQLPLLVVIVVVAMAVLVYAALGRPGLDSHMPVARAASAGVAASMQSTSRDKAGSIESLLAGLEQRLQEQPDDGGNWMLLAKSYDHLGRHEDAKQAYDKAAALGVVDEAFAAKLDSRSAGPATAAPEAAGMEVRGRVSVAPGVADRIDAGDTVFVFAIEPGQPMPIAVLRKPAAELPFDFVLDDSSSMLAARGLSSVPMVTVTAKVSSTGNVADAPAELAASGRTLAPAGGAFVELTLGDGASR